MIVRTVDEILGTDRDVKGSGFASRRLLLAKDGVGFSMSETTADAGIELTMWYKYHLEANFVLEGKGTVQNLDTGEIFVLSPGTSYTLDKHDRHIVKAITQMKFLCIFTPPLTGQETHDDDGSYVPPA